MDGGTSGATGGASDAQPDQYIDIEVLDAIAFRIEGGKEVILNMDQAKAVPYIIDNTGGNHGKTPGDATQRTHMARVTSGTDASQMIDVEVMDCVAFRDQRGEEWILDMQSAASPFNVSDGTGGGSTTTRRTHNEKVYEGDPKTQSGDFLTIERCDNVAFRRVRGEETVICCPSSDDPNSSTSFGRASTFMTPQGYDPSDDTSPAPPLLAASGDQHVYVAPVSEANGFITGAAKIAQGPFWWIRKVQSSGWYLDIVFGSTSNFDSIHGGSIYNFTPILDGLPDPLASIDVVNDPSIPASSTVPITADAVTAAMLGAYTYWTTDPEITDTSEPFSDTFTVIDAAWFTAVINNVVSGFVAYGVATPDVTAAQAAVVIFRQILTETFGGDWSNTNIGAQAIVGLSQLGQDYLTHQETENGISFTHTINGHVGINLAKMKAAATEANNGVTPDTLSFTVTFPAQASNGGSGSASMTIGASKVGASPSPGNSETLVNTGAPMAQNTWTITVDLTTYEVTMNGGGNNGGDGGGPQ